jgi:hypothetical protein
MECPNCAGRDVERQDHGGAEPDVAVCHDPDCQHVWEIA